MTFAEYFTVLQRRWRMWSAGLVLGLLAAVGANAATQVSYTATATSFVSVAETVDRSGQGEIFQGSQFTVQRVKSYAPLVSGPDVLQPVIDELRLDLTVRELARKVSVTSAPETVLLDVSVNDPDPILAAKLADAIAAQLGDVIESLETARAGGPSNVRVSLARPADVPLHPSSPRTLLNLMLGAVAGLAIGLAAALVRHHLDTRVKTSDDVRAITHMSPLGATLHERGAGKHPLVALNSRSVSAERFRTVRTALKFVAVDSELRHFAITSSVAGEGKTSVACNLAISWAQTGESVCLVEADLRRPSACRLLGIDGSLGLSDLLVGQCTIDDVLVRWNGDMVTVLPAGSLPPDPAALLGSAAMTALVADLRERFDIVIYDAPPALLVTDAVVLGHQLDGVVLVIGAGSTRPHQVRLSMEQLATARVALLGSVLAHERGRRRSEGYGNVVSRGRSRTELALRPGPAADDGHPQDDERADTESDAGDRPARNQDDGGPRISATESATTAPTRR